MIHHPKFRFTSCLSLAALLCVTWSIARAEEASRGPAVKFRQSKVDVSSLSTSSAPVSGGVSANSEDLSEQKQTLEDEVRYARAKLDAAQKKLATATASGSLEQADKIEEDVKTWQARLQEKKAQLNEVTQELTPTTTGNSQTVVPGETLELYVVEDPSFNGRYQVRRGGYIVVPQVGRVPVAGKTIDGAEASVKKALQTSQLRKASVMLEPVEGSDVVSGPTIYLSGEFKHPRPYQIPAGTAPTLISVMLSSGGFTETADLTHVKVMRVTGNRPVNETVNVQAILDGKSTGLGADLTLTEGDVIVIPVGEPTLVYVTGNVKRQGSFKLVVGEKLTAYGVILQSGGFARFADKKGVYVLRAMPDGTKVKIKVDVVAITKGLRPDVQLEANDIVMVPEKFFSF